MGSNKILIQQDSMPVTLHQKQSEQASNHYLAGELCQIILQHFKDRECRHSNITSYSLVRFPQFNVLLLLLFEIGNIVNIYILLSIMSSEEYNRKLEQSKKVINTIRKDLRYREDQEKRGQTTYSIDSEIRGSFGELGTLAERLEQIFGNFRANPKDFGLTNKEIEKRRQQLNQVLTERTNLQRQYDSYFQKKSKNDLLGNESSDKNKPDYTKMNSRDLSQHKAKQEQEQEEAIEDLVNVVKNIKQGQKGINQELHEQDGALNQLDRGMDENTKNMGKVRRNMMKLLDESSNCCLISVIVVELVAIFCIIFLWN